jgi:hypothetical protein
VRCIAAVLGLFALSSQSDAAEMGAPGDLTGTLLHGCWNHNEFQFTDTPGDKPKLIRSQLACFNDRGVATGVTLDDGDGWEWIHRYVLEGDSLIVGEQSWGRVLDASATRLLLINGEILRAYDLVCRKPGEDVQCDRLQYKIE